MPVDVVPHYRPCLLAWYLTKGQCLLARCYCNWHFTSPVQIEEGWLQVCATCTEVPLHQTSLLFRCNTLIYASLYSATLSYMHAVFIYSDTRDCKVLHHQARHLVYMVQIHQTCLQVGCRSHGFVKLVGYQSGRHLEYMNFWGMHE